MSGELIDHIGFLVPDLEAAIERWSKVTGYTFSPIARYRTDNYSDSSDPEPHHHDTRISFSKEGPPYIELMSVAGTGTHGPNEVGVHHIALRNIEDIPGRLALCAEAGVGEDGRSLLDDGRVHLCFTRKDDLDGIRLELISPLVGPTVADDGSELPIDPVTGRKNLWR